MSKPPIPTTVRVPLPRLTDVEAEIGKLARESYVPAKHRTKDLGELTIQAVKNFSELPTKEIDDLIVGIKTKLDQIERKAQAIKNDYMQLTTELTREIAKLNSVCVKSETKMEELHDQLSEIYATRETENGYASQVDVRAPEADRGPTSRNE